MNLVKIPAESLAKHYNELMALISKIEYHDTYDPMEVIALGMMRKYQFLGVEDEGALIGLIITEFREEGGHKYCRLVLCNGKSLTKWVHYVQNICDWCKAQGCEFVEGTGREGWFKILKPHGFQKVSITMRKQL